jgi:hypothetical protein
MSDARWIEVEDDIESACRHFGNAAMLYDQGGFDVADLSGYKSRMALLHAMQAGHTSLEAALKRVLEILGEDSPAGDYSHADLIKRAARAITAPGLARPAILSDDIARAADESRQFRHRATHDYDNFVPALAVPSIEAARVLSAGLKRTIQKFRDVIDPPR